MKKQYILIACASLIAWGCNPEKKDEKSQAKCFCTENAVQESAAKVEPKIDEQSTSAAEVKAPELQKEATPVETAKSPEVTPAPAATPTAVTQVEVKK